jgi:hypothetical protein
MNFGSLYVLNDISHGVTVPNVAPNGFELTLTVQFLSEFLVLFGMQIKASHSMVLCKKWYERAFANISKGAS